MTLYLGARSEQRQRLSWTLERSVAESKFFAKRNGSNVYTIRVPRGAILVYYADRQEAEVLVDLGMSPDPELAV